MIRWKRWWPELSERMPVDVMPISNGEFIPPEPTAEQRSIMRIQNAKAEELRRKMGLSRRDFVRTSAALAVGFWAIDKYVAEANHTTTAACDVDNPTAQLANLPGEFIFDIQTHHVDEDGMWRVMNPGFAAFFTAVWTQSGCGETDRMDCLGRLHYLKEVYLDSSTTMGVLSAVPSSPDRNPLPTKEAIDTVRLTNELARSQRAVMHSFVMPNRGSYGVLGAAGKNPLYLQEELDKMSLLAETQGDIVRGWKCYTPWGDVPNASGWFHDDMAGRAMIRHAIALGINTIATHKGFALPSFDQRSAACRDIGIVGRDYPACNFIVYHSGYDNDVQAAYAGDPAIDSAAYRGTDGLIKSLRENGWSARNFAPGGTPGKKFADGDPTVHANTPNVYAEIGSTWRSVMNSIATYPDGKRHSGVQAAHLLGKLIYYVGPRRVVWGTDSLWYGSPQPEIVRMRQFPRSDETEAKRILAEVYNLPWGLDGDIDDPDVHVMDPALPSYNPARSIRNGIFGRNAAVPYKVSADQAFQKINCDDVERLRSDTVLQPATAQEMRPMASNVMWGPRTRRELFANVWPNKPWAP